MTNLDIVVLIALAVYAILQTIAVVWLRASFVC